MRSVNHSTSEQKSALSHFWPIKSKFPRCDSLSLPQSPFRRVNTSSVFLSSPIILSLSLFPPPPINPSTLYKIHAIICCCSSSPCPVSMGLPLGQMLPLAGLHSLRKRYVIKNFLYLSNFFPLANIEDFDKLTNKHILLHRRTLSPKFLWDTRGIKCNHQTLTN